MKHLRTLILYFGFFSGISQFVMANDEDGRNFAKTKASEFHNLCYKTNLASKKIDLCNHLQMDLFNEAIAYAKNHNKILMIIFEASYCAGCKLLIKEIDDDTESNSVIWNKSILLKINVALEESFNKIQKKLKYSTFAFLPEVTLIPSAEILKSETNGSVILNHLTSEDLPSAGRMDLNFVKSVFQNIYTTQNIEENCPDNRPN